MAKYIPPHKRNPNHHPNLTSKSSKQHLSFAKDCITKWFVVPFSYDTDDDEHELPCSVQLKQFLYQPIERKRYRESMILAFKDPSVKVGIIDSAKAPWMSIVEKMHHELLVSFERARKEMCNHGGVLEIPYFVFRLGKVFFDNNSLIDLENVNKSSEIESALGGLHRAYNTNMPESFVKAILSEFIHKIGLEFEEELDYYQVKVIDRYLQNHSFLSCRCTVVEAVGELDLYEIELNKLRHLVVDLSCLNKSLDLRLMLSSKRTLTLTSLNDDEKHSLSQLLKSAVIDSEVKGGLRWPFGMDSVDGRFSVVGSCHSKDKVFKNSVMRLKVGQADRFDFQTSTGEVTHEASLMVTELNHQLQDERFELEPLVDMVGEMVKLIWDNFLCWNGSYV